MNISVELSHLTLLTVTDYFPHIIKKKMDVKIDCNWKNILLLNYAVFKTIEHVLVLYQTSNKLG